MNNHDLDQSFGSDNYDAAKKHWFEHGQKEGRDCTCADQQD